jgi:hypothetical protein
MRQHRSVACPESDAASAQGNLRSGLTGIDVAATPATERAASCVSARRSALDCDLAWRARDDFGRTGVVAHESSHTDRAPSILDLWSPEGRSVLDPDHDAEPCRVWVRAADVEKCGRAITRRSELRAGHSPDESRNAPLKGDSLLPTDGAVARHRCRSEDERAGGRGAGGDYTRGDSSGNHPDGEEGSFQGRSFRRRGVMLTLVHSQGEVNVRLAGSGLVTADLVPELAHPPIRVGRTAASFARFAATSSTVGRARSSRRLSPTFGGSSDRERTRNRGRRRHLASSVQDDTRERSRDYEA